MLKKNAHTRCSTNCLAALRPRGAFLRRRAPRPPAASLHHAGVREDGSPPRPSSGRQALPKTGPTWGGGATARRVARGAGIRRRHDYSVCSVARRAWVQALGCARPWASARPNLQGNKSTARRPTSKRSRCCARRDVKGRRVGRFHGEVVAAARWGATGLDTRDQPRFGRNSRLDGRYSRTQGSARRHLEARRRIEGFSLGSAN
jgi:hypothetical protein